jgi:hypothetical protein
MKAQGTLGPNALNKKKNISHRVSTSFADERCTDLSSVHFPAKHDDMIPNSYVTTAGEAALP